MLIIIVYMLWYDLARAQTPPLTVNVRASRLDALDERSPGLSMTVIDRAEMERRGARTVGDLLKETAGMRLTETGGPGQPTSAFVRGAGAEQTLVLLDGLPLNDASSVARAFDFSQLSIDGLERVEIYRGPETLRFGAGATGGVINLISQRGEGATRLKYAAETGSFQTMRLRAAHGGQLGRLRHNVYAHRSESEGISARAALPTAERDGTRTLSAGVAVGYDFSRVARADFTWRGQWTQTELDSSGPQGDVPDSDMRARTNSVSARYEERTWGDHLASSYLVGYQEETRDYHYGTFASALIPFAQIRFDGGNLQLQTRHAYETDAGDRLELVLQSSSERARVENSREVRATDFSQAVLAHHRWNAWTFSAGARHDGMTNAGDAWTSSFSPSFTAGDTTVLARWATGVRQPSLAQLYSAFGNRELKAELTRAWDLGVRQTFARGDINLTYFDQTFLNMIAFNPAPMTYANIGRARARGAELESGWTWTDTFSMRAAYTYLEARDEQTGLALPRRPAHAFTLGANWRWRSWEAGLNWRGVGAREDFADLGRVRLPYYDVWSARLALRVHERLSLSARAENLFGRVFEDVVGYGAPGFAAYVGVDGML